MVAPQKVNTDNEVAHYICLCNIYYLSYMAFTCTGRKMHTNACQGDISIVDCKPGNVGFTPKKTQEDDIFVS